METRRVIALARSDSQMWDAMMVIDSIASASSRRIVSDPALRPKPSTTVRHRNGSITETETGMARSVIGDRRLEPRAVETTHYLKQHQNALPSQFVRATAKKQRLSWRIEVDVAGVADEDLRAVADLMGEQVGKSVQGNRNWSHQTGKPIKGRRNLKGLLNNPWVSGVGSGLVTLPIGYALGAIFGA